RPAARILPLSCNAVSRAAAQRWGFCFEGVFRQAAVHKGRDRDTAWYAVIDQEWPCCGRHFNAGSIPPIPAPTARSVPLCRPGLDRYSSNADEENRMGQLTDKLAVVTGASTGIGRSISLAFAKEGARVVLAARRPEPLDELAKEIQAAGGTAMALSTDVTVEEQVMQLFRRAIDAFGRVDVLVN